MSNQGRKMEVAVASEKGLRDENQDCMSWKQVPWGELFIVADGMGGHKGGAIAAKMTVEGLEKHLTQMQRGGFEKALREAVQRVNEQIYSEAHSGNPETESMGCTLVVALISADGELQFGHIGDSRAYLFRKGHLRRLTKDHTTLQRMLDAGMLTAEEARNHPDASVLSRAVGSKPEVEIEIGEPVKLEEGDALLLCSDGLSGFVEDRQIRQTVQRQSEIQRVPRALVDLALKSGSDDNITLQFARFGRRTHRIRELITSPVTWAVLALIAVLAGLGLQGPTIKQKLIAMLGTPPPTMDFHATKTYLNAGESTTLEWSAKNADKVHIDPDEGDFFQANGSKDVQPTTSVKYIATATGPGGSVSKDVSVTVVGPPPTPAAKPTIILTASPTKVKAGQSIRLHWKAQNAVNVHIEPGIGDVSPSGDQDVTPATSVTYTAVATGPGGSKSADVSVKVGSAPLPKPPTLDFHASKTSLNAGESIKLQWNTKNADKVHIDPGIGDLPASGSKDVQPTTSIQYTAIATGPGGSATKEVSVTVVAPPAAKPTIVFTASKTTVQLGESIQLHWDTQNADKVHIDPDVGDYPPGSGVRTLLPTTTVTYKATATGPGGTVSKEVPVTVVPQQTASQPTITFDADKTSVKPGDRITLNWSTQNATKVHIEPEIGDVPPNGSKEVTPKTSAKYTATATGPGGSKSAQVSIAVESAPPAQPPTITFTATKTKNLFEKKIELKWNVQNAQNVHIESDVPVDPPLGRDFSGSQGELRVKLQKSAASVSSVTFTATATGPGGSVVKTAKVEIKVESQ